MTRADTKINETHEKNRFAKLTHQLTTKISHVQLFKKYESLQLRYFS